MMRTSLWSTLLLVIASYGGTSIVHAEDNISFNRDVRAILSDKCFFCHGPDADNREADLRLDVRDNAIEHTAIVPGQPQDSELLRRVSSTDEFEQMPPPDSKIGRLTPAEIATLSKWIDQGAEYETHWSFKPLTISAEPINVTNEIDRHVESDLAQHNLTFQPEAPRETLIRRLSFDLTGLPPSPEDVKQFANDNTPDAYEQLVDRLLASPHYGERMAADWLDVARYADSYGFQVDRERTVWPWRDWVIQAFNDNLPYDDFLTWQLAGDLLPNPTREQVLATTFNRLHQQESEGGSVEEEYRVEYVCDRVQTFGTAFLGLTVECARCHDHKFDPITQREFYQFFAMFQNIDEAGLYSFFTQSVPTPTLALPDNATATKIRELTGRVTQLESAASTLRDSRRADFEQWLAALPHESQNDESNLVGEIAHFPFDDIQGDQLTNTVTADAPAQLVGKNQLVEGHSGQAIQFTGDDPVNLKQGNFTRATPFSIALWLKTPDEKERSVVFHRSRWTDAGSRGYELLIEDGRLKWSLIHFWPGNAISIATETTIPINTWQHVVVTYDGSSRAAGLQIFLNGEQVATNIVRDNLTNAIQGGGGDHITLGERFRDRGFKDGLIDEFRIFERRITALEVKAIHGEQTLSNQIASEQSKLNTSDQPATELLFELFLSTIDPEWAHHREALAAVRTELNTLSDSVPEIMVMREMEHPKPAFILTRGEYNQHGEEVFANTPAALPPMQEQLPKNRLGLARWLTAPNHPLTARVAANRLWQGLFGYGLVKTAEDFGSQGDRPTHPEVLDALAIGFIQSDWNTKALLKSIVMSKTYRQCSFADPQTMADDPENDWLARGPRHRLTAEMIRDNALAAANLLDRTIGGPPVNPYEMSEAFKPATPSTGTGLYRRSLYTNWRRTGPPPTMIVFDAPRRAVCTVQRERTDSPLQALVLLNGTQFVEAARVLGEHLHQEHNGDRDQIITASFLKCLSRTPDETEQRILNQLYAEQVAHFKNHPEAAKNLLEIGEAPRNAAIDAPTAAALTMLVQALLNHDECVVKQ